MVTVSLSIFFKLLCTQDLEVECDFVKDCCRETRWWSTWTETLELGYGWRGGYFGDTHQRLAVAS